jgi:dUTP pyrophosphatase
LCKKYGAKEYVKMKVIIEELEKGFMPERATDGSVGYDLKSRESVYIAHGTIVCVATGIKLQLPLGYEAQIRPRSGLAKKFGVTVLNSPATIDSDYRGEVSVLLINHGALDYPVAKGQCIAQMVFNKVELPIIIQDKVNETVRGEGGFGSTG